MAIATAQAQPKPTPIAPPSDDTIIGKAYDPQITRRLLKYVAPYRRNIFAAMALAVMGTLAGTAGPYLVKVAIDTGIVGRDERALAQTLALFLLSAAILWVAGYTRIRIMAVTGQSVIYDLRREMYDHLQALSLGFYSRYAVGRIISRVMNDVSVLREMIVWALVDIFRAAFDLVGIFVAMILLNAQLSLITFLVLPVMIAATEIFRRRARASYRHVRSAIGWVNAVLNENIVGVRVVQSFSREERNFRFFADNVNGNNLRVNNQAALIVAVFFPTIDFLSSVALGAVILVGGLAVFGSVNLGDLTAGTLTAFALYIDRFFGPIRALSQRYNTFQATMAGGERIFELLDTPVTVLDAPDARALPAIRGAVEFRDVSFHYEDDKIPVLEKINLRVTPGQTIALVGETGAGKSTLVKLVSRFYDPTEGAVLIDGNDVRTVTQKSLRSQMGVVLQDPFLFAGTVRDNIAYGDPDATNASIQAAARAVGADDFIRALEHGYDALVGEGGAILSGGQKQLVSFARALHANPRILLLDEATSSVDTQTERIIQAALEKLFQDRTVFVIAHRLSTITRADQIVVIDQGRIVEQGTHQQLLERRGRYFDLYTMAFAERNGV
ncbi:MAG: ABC transporter ATP-binding protein [Chloroflexi bacterium]|nr:ABC transporter ATP-binding protein [Chloroflexota bacterium]